MNLKNSFVKVGIIGLFLCSILFTITGPLTGPISEVSAAEEEIPKGIHLSIPGDPRSQIAISWFTHSETQTMVEYGLVNDTTLLTAGMEDVSTSLEVLNDETYMHHVILTNLSHNTTYYYRVGGDQSGWSPIHKFKTAPESNSTESNKVHFVVMGDNRSDRLMRRLVMRTIIQNETSNFEDDIQFIVHVGDFVSRGNRNELWEGYWEDAYITGVHQRIPMLPIQGNHEFGGMAESYYREQFVLPENGMDEWYYSLRYGSTYWVACDSEAANHGIVPFDQISTSWLTRAFEISNQDPSTLWNFAYYHQPYYVSSSHTPREDLREIWGPIFDEQGVDIIFNGHCHLYERSYPTSWEKIIDWESEVAPFTFEDPDYPITIVTGSGGLGGPIDRTPQRDNEYMAFQNYTWEYVDIQISNDDINKKTTLDLKVVGIIPSIDEETGLYNENDTSNTFILDNITISKDIPDDFYTSTNTTYPYNFIHDDKAIKVKGLAITAVSIILMVIVDIIIIKYRKKKIMQKKEEKD